MAYLTTGTSVQDLIGLVGGKDQTPEEKQAIFAGLQKRARQKAQPVINSHLKDQKDQHTLQIAETRKRYESGFYTLFAQAKENNIPHNEMLKMFAQREGELRSLQVNGEVVFSKTDIDSWRSVIKDSHKTHKELVVVDIWNSPGLKKFEKRVEETDDTTYLDILIDSYLQQITAMGNEIPAASLTALQNHIQAVGNTQRKKLAAIQAELTGIETKKEASAGVIKERVEDDMTLRIRANVLPLVGLLRDTAGDQSSLSNMLRLKENIGYIGTILTNTNHPLYEASWLVLGGREGWSGETHFKLLEDQLKNEYVRIEAAIKEKETDLERGQQRNNTDVAVLDLVGSVVEGKWVEGSLAREIGVVEQRVARLLANGVTDITERNSGITYLITHFGAIYQRMEALGQINNEDRMSLTAIVKAEATALLTELQEAGGDTGREAQTLRENIKSKEQRNNATSTRLLALSTPPPGGNPRNYRALGISLTAASEEVMGQYEDDPKVNPAVLLNDLTADAKMIKAEYTLQMAHIKSLLENNRQDEALLLYNDIAGSMERNLKGSLESGLFNALFKRQDLQQTLAPLAYIDEFGRIITINNQIINHPVDVIEADKISGTPTIYTNLTEPFEGMTQSYHRLETVTTEAGGEGVALVPLTTEAEIKAARELVSLPEIATALKGMNPGDGSLRDFVAKTQMGIGGGKTLTLGSELDILMSKVRQRESDTGADTMWLSKAEQYAIPGIEALLEFFGRLEGGSGLFVTEAMVDAQEVVDMLYQMLSSVTMRKRTIFGLGDGEREPAIFENLGTWFKHHRKSGVPLAQELKNAGVKFNIEGFTNAVRTIDDGVNFFTSLWTGTEEGQYIQEKGAWYGMFSEQVVNDLKIAKAVNRLLEKYQSYIDRILVTQPGMSVASLKISDNITSPEERFGVVDSIKNHPIKTISQALLGVLALNPITAPAALTGIVGLEAAKQE